MAKRIRLTRCTELPLGALMGYVLSGLLLCIGGALQFGTQLRGPLLMLAVIAFLAGALVQVLNKIDDHNTEMLVKITESVGDVWDAGTRSGRRHAELEAASRPQQGLSVVRDAAPR